LHRAAAARPQTEFLQRLADILKAEREENLRRQQVIDKRQEEREQREREDSAAESKRREDEQRKLKESEVQRMRQEQAARAQQKEEEAQRAAELDQVKLIYATVAASVAGQKGGAPRKGAAQKIDEMQDREKILAEAKQVLLQQKEDKEKRLDKEAKRMEYFERACREEERPLLLKQWESIQEQEVASQASNKQNRLAEAKLQWEKALEEKERLSRMVPAWEKFREKVLAMRQQDFEEGEEEWEEQ
jgi:translation initiation factor 3 subunit A